MRALWRSSLVGTHRAEGHPTGMSMNLSMKGSMNDMCPCNTKERQRLVNGLFCENTPWLGHTTRTTTICPKSSAKQKPSFTTFLKIKIRRTSRSKQRHSSLDHHEHCGDVERLQHELHHVFLEDLEWSREHS